jgi:hypothetical protein
MLTAAKGVYEDRRYRSAVDCSRTIWVLATNAIDEKIMEFCNQHSSVIFDEKDHVLRPRLIKDLSRIIKDEFKEKFSVGNSQLCSADYTNTIYSASYHRPYLSVSPLSPILAR